MIQIIPNFHPVVVHFPIVLTIVAFISALAAQLFKKRVFASHLTIISHYMLWAAAATVLVAISFGWLAYNSVNHDDAGHAAMTVHKFWAFITAAVLVLLALFDIKKHLLNTIFPLYFVVLLGVASASVGATAWLGGEVVYRHGIGVLSMPAQMIEGMQHEHSTNVPHAAESNTEPASMEGHDMSTMPMADEVEPDGAGEPNKENHDTSIDSKLPVQDESKPHTYQHEHEHE